MLIRQKPTHKLTILFAFLAGLFVVSYYSCDALAQEQEPPAPEADTEAMFPLLALSGQGGAMVRHEAPGGLLGAELTLNAVWVHANIRASVGFLGNSKDDALFAELSGYAHLLAIGIADVTYRHYLDGHEFRMLGGFSYTNSVENIVRVDVNLGPAYFHSIQSGVETVDQFGLQIGTRVTVRYWQLQNTFYLAAFQTLRFGDAGSALTDTIIVCDTSGVLTGDDLVCVFPEPEPGPDATVGFVDWLHTGMILHNRTFIWLHQEDDVQMGPELELRFEHMPLRGPHFWAMVSFRAQWATN